MLDHMPEQFPLRGVVYGQRWVSTPACRAARVVDGELLAPIHYVTLYLMTDPIDETLDEFMALGRRSARGRPVPRAPNRAHLSGPFSRRRRRGRAARAGLRRGGAVPPEPRRLRRRRGRAGRGRRGLAWRCVDVPGVAGVWTFATGERLRGRTVEDRASAASRCAGSTTIPSPWRVRSGPSTPETRAWSSPDRSRRWCPDEWDWFDGES